MINFIIQILQSIIALLGKKKFGPPPEFEGQEVPNESTDIDVHTPVPSNVVTVKDYINVLPWHPTRRWGTRPLTNIDSIVVHQAAGTGSVKGINTYHITPGPNNHISNEGAPHICYHYVIDRDGSIYKVNSLTSVVWHCKGQNSNSIGILVLGNFSGPSYSGSQEPTVEQVNSLENLVLAYTNNEAEEHTKGLIIDKNKVFGHRDFGKENCPGNVLYSFLQDYKS